MLAISGTTVIVRCEFRIQFSFVRLLRVVLCAIYCLFPVQKQLNISWIQKTDSMFQYEVQYYSWCNPAADDHCVTRSLCQSVSLPSLILSSNRRSHANVSYLSQPLQSTQCPPGPHRLSNLSWPEYQWQQSFNLWNLELACCMNYINLKSGSVCQLMQKAIANTWLES